LRLIREKLAVKQASTIALNVLVVNLQKLLEILFVFITALLRLLIGTDTGQYICQMPSHLQMTSS
jgi:IS5 family transposase